MPQKLSFGFLSKFGLNFEILALEVFPKLNVLQNLNTFDLSFCYGILKLLLDVVERNTAFFNIIASEVFFIE